MATVNFSVPDEVKQEFNHLFANQNKSALLTRLMQQAINDHKKQQRRTAAMDKILELHDSLPQIDAEMIEKARSEIRQ